MNDIAELERRISAALERIGQGIDGWQNVVAAPSTPAGDDKAQAGLKEALEEERATNAQLTERVRAIKEKQENMVGALEKKVASLTQSLDAAMHDLQKQRRLNAELTATNQALSDAARTGLTEPHLINKSMLTELEALRAARAADVAEMEEILAELKPLIGEVA
jgi:chromosome segregation ATPase